MTDSPLPPGEPDDLDALGAAPTLPVDGGGTSRSRGSRRIPKLKGRPLSRILIVLAVVVGLALVPTFLSSLKKTPRNMVGISYGGGPFEAAHFQRIVMPGSSLFFNGFFDPLYLYPADTQSYIVSKVPNQGTVKTADSIISPSKDRVQIEYQVAVYFKLNINRLQAFHEQLGLQYGAYTSGGWSRLIQDTFRQQIENALQEETRKYEVADIYGNADALTTIQTDVEKKLSVRLTTALGQPFFCGPTYKLGPTCTSPTFIIKKIDIPADVVKAFQDNRTSQIQVLTSQNQIAQRTAEAQAIEALNAGLSQAGMNYVLLRAIESGNISFWVLPSDTGLTLQAPSTGTGGAPTVPAPSTTTSTTVPPKSTTTTTTSSN
jgi:regulator of protease activity HflC (stomatin/prohibitin superfamily)